MSSQYSPQINAEPSQVRAPDQRRRPPDRGIVLLSAKDRIGPEIWALYGKVDKPTILKDDLYLDPSKNNFCRDKLGHCFLLLPYANPEAADCFEIADNAYRRARALGVTEKPEIFFTCVYQFQLPDYRCIDVHRSKGEEILEEDKCIKLVTFEKARLFDQISDAQFNVHRQSKINPVTIYCAGQPSTNLVFALNNLVLHHNYTTEALQQLWEQS